MRTLNELNMHGKFVCRKPAKSHGTPKSSTEQAWAYGELIIT